MIKKFYRIMIVPYTLFLLYLMLLGMGRRQYEDNLLTLVPVFSTVNFIRGCISWKEMVIIVGGNFVMFIPFGFLGWIFVRFRDLKTLLFAFVSSITIVEGVQYFTRMGIFEVDDIILNTFGMISGFALCRFVERKFQPLTV